MIKNRKEHRLGFGIKVGYICPFVNSVTTELLYTNHSSGGQWAM